MRRVWCARVFRVGIRPVSLRCGAGSDMSEAVEQISPEAEAISSSSSEAGGGTAALEKGLGKPRCRTLAKHMY